MLVRRSAVELGAQRSRPGRGPLTVACVELSARWSSRARARGADRARATRLRRQDLHGQACWRATANRERVAWAATARRAARTWPTIWASCRPIRCSNARRSRRSLKAGRLEHNADQIGAPALVAPHQLLSKDRLVARLRRLQCGESSLRCIELAPQGQQRGYLGVQLRLERATCHSSAAALAPSCADLRLAELTAPASAETWLCPSLIRWRSWPAVAACADGGARRVDAAATATIESRAPAI